MNTTRRPGILGVQSGETIYEWCAALRNTLYMKDSKLCIIIAVFSSILIHYFYPLTITKAFACIEQFCVVHFSFLSQFYFMPPVYKKLLNITLKNILCSFFCIKNHVDYLFIQYTYDEGCNFYFPHNINVLYFILYSRCFIFCHMRIFV